MNISEFRGDIAEQFNIAGNGTPVFITRTGQTFKLELDEKKVATISKTRLTTFKDDVIDVDLPTTFKRDTKICKIHGTPLTNTGNCLQKGCKK